MSSSNISGSSHSIQICDGRINDDLPLDKLDYIFSLVINDCVATNNFANFLSIILTCRYWKLIGTGTLSTRYLLQGRSIGNTILDLLDSEHSEARTQLEALLSTEPSEKHFVRACELYEAVIRATPANQQERVFSQILNASKVQNLCVAFFHHLHSKNRPNLQDFLTHFTALTNQVLNLSHGVQVQNETISINLEQEFINAVLYIEQLYSSNLEEKIEWLKLDIQFFRYSLTFDSERDTVNDIQKAILIRMNQCHPLCLKMVHRMFNLALQLPPSDQQKESLVFCIENLFFFNEDLSLILKRIRSIRDHELRSNVFESLNEAIKKYCDALFKDEIRSPNEIRILQSIGMYGVRTLKNRDQIELADFKQLSKSYLTLILTEVVFRKVRIEVDHFFEKMAPFVTRVIGLGTQFVTDHTPMMINRAVDFIRQNIQIEEVGDAPILEN